MALFGRQDMLGAGRADRLSQMLFSDKWGDDKRWEALDVISMPGQSAWAKRLLLWQLANENAEIRNRAWEVLQSVEIDYDVLVSELRCPMWQVRVGVIRLLAKSDRLDVVKLLVGSFEDYHESVVEETRKSMRALIEAATARLHAGSLDINAVHEAMHILSRPLYQSKRSSRFQAVEFFIRMAHLHEDYFWNIYLGLELPQWTLLHDEFNRLRRDGGLVPMYRGLLQMNEELLERLTQFISVAVRQSGDDVNYHLQALRQLNEDDFVRIAFVLQHYRVLVDFQGLIKHMNPPERIVLFDLLQCVGAEQNLAFLHRCLELDDSRIRIRVLKILGESETLPLQKEVYQFLTDTDEQLLLATLRYIRKKGDLKVLDRLQHLLRSKRPKVRRGVITTIYVIMRDNLLKDFDQLASARRKKIIAQLIKMKPDFFEEISYLSTSQEPADRIKYLKMLPSHRFEPAISELKRLSLDRDAKVRSCAVSGFERIKDDDDRLRAIEPFLQDSDPRVRANAIELLPKDLVEKYVPLLRKSVKSSVNREKANAIQKLLEWGYRDVEPELEQMLNSSDEWVKASALWVVGHSDTPQFVNRLRLGANDPHAPVREMSVRGLGLKGTEEDIRALMPFLQDPERKVRVVAQQALRNRLNLSFEIA